MNGWAEVLIAEIIRVHGMLSEDSDWIDTFEVPYQEFDYFVKTYNGYVLNKYGFDYMECGNYKIRRSIPSGYILGALWKEMSEENISQPANSK